MAEVRVQVQDQVAVLVLDNPPVNVLSRDMANRLRRAVDEAASREDIVALVVTGAGDRAFVAGADIKEFPRVMAEDGAEDLALDLDASLDALAACPKPTIAALNGVTLGGGLELALACDFRIAEVQVQLGFPEVKLGLFPGAGGTQRLPRLIGASRAKELIFCGEPISAEEAHRMGLVNRVVETGQAVQAAVGFAQVFRARSLASLALAKRAIDEGLEMTLADGIRNEAHLFGEVFRTRDAAEGVQAFLEKRAPRFTHR
ncbi:enoyl-CoA hydratase/isomerase family protein [Alicyclobacillus macrosporangiidus]|uniref:Enoyl-CoA hydratase/carnithine racemase n=1 Tax=Alicyclobacillus macrosporangiidus TaxID=392015 RepID=A0A1I7JB85_9BACL|nr:enoyl-CoA hydratase-related protein [Alicyclobacillus macrosporangiidus]SFU82435.1 Enoyl-CoA hydratase/carnithine racemase [Alicyclobacillus macrosporangiidus]